MAASVKEGQPGLSPAESKAKNHKNPCNHWFETHGSFV